MEVSIVPQAGVIGYARPYWSCDLNAGRYGLLVNTPALPAETRAG